MGSFGSMLQTHWVLQVVHRLPAPVTRLLDAWSRRIARRHAAARQRAWLKRKAELAAAAAAKQQAAAHPSGT